ncbi:MAG TPA: 4-hydroxythreonine-4-phosphate dehydrogenase PdxA [Candidatus Dormibacteraeota bacterium]|nr:4-hydroxythreonine-4-phosphate dehydrogenase PdxA [Candidatus Dormibacteraeota bacterium]
MAARRPTLIVTMGDPAGIGPEIVARALAVPALRRIARLAVAGDPEVMMRAARRARPPLRFRVMSTGDADLHADGPGIPLVASSSEGWGAVRPGSATAASGRMAAKAIEAAAALALEGRADGVVTAPISKAALQSAGYPYPGHTEFFGALAGVPDTRMLFVGGDFRILLASVHLPLRQVADAVTVESLGRTLEFAAAALRNFRWGARAVVAVLAMNPHAGEGGLFGDEEKRVIGPGIEVARARGIRVEGPYPADTFFAKHKNRRDLGIVVAMYHDQGLIPAKSGGIGGAANVTLGLPFVRSSVDHGTAFDRAWKGGARAPDPAGLVTAIKVGAELAKRAVRPLEWTWP